jgi:hypothetical protein
MALPNLAQIELPLLREILAAGGEARPADLYPRMRHHFPAIEEVDLQAKLASTGGNSWHNRIQWARQHLVIKGQIYRQPRGMWRITPEGIERAKASESTETVVRVPEPQAETASQPDPSVSLVADQVEILCERLVRAQNQSSSPKNFEQALAEAFRFLDFDVLEQGKAGETDLILQSHIGSDSYRVVVDAKATHGDKIAENQINWLAIQQHQQQAQADYVAVVGVDFRGGNLTKWAAQHEVALIRTSDLTSVIRMFRATPFSLNDLRTLFSKSGTDRQRMQDLELIHKATTRHWKLLVDVIDQIGNYNRFNEAGLVATPDGVQLMLYSRIASQSRGTLDPSGVPSKEEVRDAMIFLATRAVGVLKEAPAESGHYHLTMHADGALHRIEALAQHLQDVDFGAENPAGRTIEKGL